MRYGFWKYCNKKACNEFLLSLHLFNNNWSDNQKIACLYTVSNDIESHYQTREIPKRNGGTRIIHTPDYLLKEIQKNILNAILNQYQISKYATAYHKNTSILKNAIPHLQKEIILKLDIKDFFSHITMDIVKQLVFIDTIYPPQIQQLLAQLCCYKGSIPQGAPTSAAISNLIMKELDEKIGAWCDERKISFTRYCDDFTFSGSFEPVEVIEKVTEELSALQFQLNRKKTKVLYPHQRQIVTGIIVNEKVHTPRQYRKKIRQEMYYIQTFGLKEHMNHTNQILTPEEYIHSLLGKLNYILSIQPEDREFSKYKQWIQTSIKQ